MNKGKWKKHIKPIALLLVTLILLISSKSIRRQLMLIGIENDFGFLCQACIKLGERVHGKVCITDSACAPYLNDATLFGSTSAMQVLIDNGATVDQPDFQGRTSLHSAIVKEDYAAVMVLLANGASATLPDSNGQTPLSYAESTNDSMIIDEIKKALRKDTDSGKKPAPK